jgi:hypothetical protein
MHSTRRGVVYVVTNDPVPNGNAVPSYLNDGGGWGWSWFDAANPVKTTSKDFRTDCLGCHIPAKATDWIYVSGYPGLKK